MDKKRGFSFLEILIVIMIVGILFVTFRGSFQVKNKDILYGQACIETIYGEVNNFLHAAISSKSLNSGGTQIFPNTYMITFVPTEQRITMTYDTTIYSTISISGQNNSQYCNNSNSLLILSGDRYEVHVNKGLQQNTHMQSVYLSGTSNVTGGNVFRGCNDQGEGCKEMARFTIDTRTITLQKQMCLQFGLSGDCLERDN